MGAGAGLKFPPIATGALRSDTGTSIDVSTPNGDGEISQITKDAVEAPLSIAEAKRRLAETFGVDPASIKITVEA